MSLYKMGLLPILFCKDQDEYRNSRVHTQHALEQVSCAELFYRLSFNTVFHIYLQLERESEMKIVEGLWFEKDS